MGIETKVERWLSPQRFSTYLAAANGDPALALDIYDWNLRLSSCCFEAIADFEVLIRNAIDGAMHDGSPDDELGWLNDPALLSARSREEVIGTRDRIVAEKSSASRHQLVAGLSFGFWTAMFSSNYENMWRSHLRKAFPFGDGRRNQVTRPMNSLRAFRNRIAHHEPIFSRDLEKAPGRTLTVAELIDPESRDWLESRHSLEHVIKLDPRS